MAKGSTGQTELPRAELELLELKIPPKNLLKKFSACIKPVFKAVQTNIETSKQLSALRDALLPKLVSGEIDVSQVDLTQLNNHLEGSCAFHHKPIIKAWHSFLAANEPQLHNASHFLNLERGFHERNAGSGNNEQDDNHTQLPTA